MISSGSVRRVFAHAGPVDMRKGFDGLFALVQEGLGRNPLSGDMFLFVSRNRIRAKVLLWDGTGLCVYAKRLEKGRFSWPRPRSTGQRRLSLTPQALAMLTDGIDLRGGSLRPWYERKED